MDGMRLMLGALLVVAVGCGGGASDGGLEGTWSASVTQECTAGAHFDGSEYSTSVVCNLGSRGFGMEIEKGTFVVSGSQVTTTATFASCQSAPTFMRTRTMAWSRSGNTLTLAASGGALILKRLPNTEAPAAVVQWGCWNGGDFAPSPLVEVPATAEVARPDGGESETVDARSAAPPDARQPDATAMQPDSEVVDAMSTAVDAAPGAPDQRPVDAAPAPARLTIAPSDFTFTRKGQTQGFVIKNIGGVPIKGLSIAVASPVDYERVADSLDCQTVLGTSKPGSSGPTCSVTIRFISANPAPNDGHLTAAGTGVEPASALLRYDH